MAFAALGKCGLESTRIWNDYGGSMWESQERHNNWKSTSFVISVYRMSAYVFVHNVHTQIDGIPVIRRDAIMSRLPQRDLGQKDLQDQALFTTT